MPAFDIVSTSPIFPDSLEGILIPHLNEANTNFIDEIKPYQATDDHLVPVFISEIEIIRTVRNVQRLHEQGRIGGLATFGILDPESTRPLGTTHMTIMATEINVPWIYLAVPDGYPSLKKDWMPHNPLVDLYHTPITLTHSTQTATITPQLNAFHS